MVKGKNERQIETSDYEGQIMEDVGYKPYKKIKKHWHNTGRNGDQRQTKDQQH